MDGSAGVPAYNLPDVIRTVFNNWTALKLAIDHGMGGTTVATTTKLNALVEEVMRFFTRTNPDWCDLSDILLDFMDSQFCTVLEDESSDEVALHLCQLWQMFTSGDTQGLVSAIGSLPCPTPLDCVALQAPPRVQEQIIVEEVEESGESEVAEDDGWTVVKRK